MKNQKADVIARNGITTLREGWNDEAIPCTEELK
jgi:hypothetical protein